MKLARISIFFLMHASLFGCGVLDVYRNQNELPNRSGKENWAQVEVAEKSNSEGKILISPRPRDSAIKALISAGNPLARHKILLYPGINDLNVYAFNGNKSALFVIKDITVEENGEYLVEYKFDGGAVKTWVIDKKTGQKINSF